jgi:hypothetical protein
VRWTNGGVCPRRFLDGRGLRETGPGGTGIVSEETPTFSAGAWIGPHGRLDANGEGSWKSIVGELLVAGCWLLVEEKSRGGRAGAR